MNILRIILLLAGTLTTVLPAKAQDAEAPPITGMAVQGTSVNLNYFQGEKNVLVIFYRTHD
jgi:hypothetical protein